MSLAELYFISLAFVTSILSSTFGFGSAIILIPFSTYLLPIKKAVAIVTIYFMAMNIAKIAVFKKHIDWRTVALIWLGAIPATYIGAKLMVTAPSEIIEKTLGLMTLAYIINDTTKITKNIHLRGRHIVAAGALHGFFSGIIGTGTVKAALLTHIGLRKERFIATMATSSLLTNIIKTAIYSESDLLSASDIPLVTALIICAVIGTNIGKHLVRKVSPETFRKAILLMLAIVSIKLIIA